jgi:hypothetical protein
MPPRYSQSATHIPADQERSGGTGSSAESVSALAKLDRRLRSAGILRRSRAFMPIGEDSGNRQDHFKL